MIKAELYRIPKLNLFWIFILLIGFFTIATPFINRAGSVEEHFYLSMDGFETMVIMMPMVAAYLTARGYHHRTSMHEVLSGNSPLRIILSKIIAIALPLTLINTVFLFTGAIIAHFTTSTGFGDIPVRILLSSLIIFRAMIFGVLLTMCIKNMAGIALVYARSIVEMIIVLIITAIKGQDMFVSDGSLLLTGRGFRPEAVFLLMQAPSNLIGEINGMMILHILAGILFEALLWGGLSYMIYKKCDY